MRNETILVTGCSGFIGGHMLERLVAENFNVVGVDDFSTGDPSNMAAVKDKIRFIEGDLFLPDVADQAVEGVDRVIHLASVPSVPRSVLDPRESARASVLAPVNLMDAARRAGVKRLVQASSSSVYGECEVLPRVETLPRSPMSPYAVAKMVQEDYAAIFYKCYGLDTVSLRYFNVFGPRQNPESKYAAVIPKFVTGMLAGVRPKIFGDGGQTRDFTYIDNVVEANLRAAMCERPLRGEAVNIGSGGGITLNELVEMLNRLLGVDFKPEHDDPRAGDILHSQADIGKAKDLLGFSPAVSFEDGLKRTVAYYSNRA